MSMKDQYRVVSELGNQKNRKFGKVYLIEDKDTNEQGVMKCFLRNPNSPGMAHRLRSEASFSFDFPGLPKIIDVLNTEDEIILVKNYVSGIQLDDYWKTIPRKQRFSELVKILSCLQPLFDTLKTQGIVHCDIKPSNILIEKVGEEIKCHLIDFGLAIRRGSENDFEVLFPLGFASPELILNRLKIVDHTTDLFALGISIWKLFTGSLPLSHPNPSIFTNLQITYPLPDHHALPRGVYSILQKMCYKQPFHTAPHRMSTDAIDALLLQAQVERYQSLNEVIEDLNKIPQKKPWWIF